ncbi:NnrU family protein [Sphingomicrobium sediminis]|uniref:NnrU family protein n=1 Tax=Sphingomicrobium sediminis TaxID=2950949 RepID=A0A9X2J2S0_9SPHN|nr:NnrU family protein [Sphingomicrobium sediminis]MCM8556586.1 NnrU family protein [Sphingomicrobium sediminis]
MSALGWLIFWSAAFAGSHLAMSHPLRAPMVKAFGTKGFQIVYSLVSLFTLVMASRAYGPANEGAAWLWGMNYWLWGLASFIMWLGSIWFVGSLRRNPALPHPEAKAIAKQPVSGVYATTRHPMMWGFAAWGLTHILVNPTPASIVISTAIIVTAIGGAYGQDRKKRLLMGEEWRDWEERTGFIPFSRGIHSMGLFALIGGTILFFAVTYAHGAMGYNPAGLWLWF